MKGHVFIALAVVFGAVVQGIPQHRFRPYRVSYNAGKLSDSVSATTGDPEPINPVTPTVETSPSTVEETPVVEQANTSEKKISDEQILNLKEKWNRAALNLLNIPFLLEWVSSLRSDTFAPKEPTTIQETQETVPESIPESPMQEETSLFVEVAQDQREASEPEVQTENYAVDYTTDTPLIEEIITESVQPENEIIESLPEQIPEEVAVIEPQTNEQIITNEPMSSVIEPEQLNTVSSPPPEVIQNEVTVNQEENIQEIVQPEPNTVVEQTNEIIATPEETSSAVPEVQPDPVAEVDPTKKSISEKVIPEDTKKPIFKFKFNRFDNQKLTAKKGKTLFSFAPEPEPSSFVFPSYSYSISHQPASYHGR